VVHSRDVEDCGGAPQRKSTLKPVKIPYITIWQYGISSAPEVFQQRMNEILSDLPGVLCHVDDILVYGKDATEHESRLQATMKRIESAGITFNGGKCQFYQSRISPS